MSRLPRFGSHARPLFLVACIVAAIGAAYHGHTIFNLILPSHGFDLTIGNALAMIGLELAVIALLASIEPTLRGMSGGLLLLAAFSVVLMGPSAAEHDAVAISWQVRAHVLIALLSYGLLTVGAIVAVFALVQERRLQAAKLSSTNQLFAPLETTERLLFSTSWSRISRTSLACRYWHGSYSGYCLPAASSEAGVESVPSSSTSADLYFSASPISAVA